MIFCSDIQSYVSRAFLYFTLGSNKILILVDNRPWLLNQQSRSARLWQLMVTKVCPSHHVFVDVQLFIKSYCYLLIVLPYMQYRMSPFANTRTRDRATNAGNETERNGCCSSNQDNARRLCRWLPVIETLKRREKYLFSAMDLSKALHGFLVFEVSWKDVHGINYLNELQVSIYGLLFCIIN